VVYSSSDLWRLWRRAETYAAGGRGVPPRSREDAQARLEGSRVVLSGVLLKSAARPLSSGGSRGRGVGRTWATVAGNVRTSCEPSVGHGNVAPPSCLEALADERPEGRRFGFGVLPRLHRLGRAFAEDRQVLVVDVELPTLTAGHLSQDCGLLEPSDRAVNRWLSQPERRRCKGCTEEASPVTWPPPQLP
jgi:hypothetical protein